MKPTPEQMQNMARCEAEALAHARNAFSGLCDVARVRSSNHTADAARVMDWAETRLLDAARRAFTELGHIAQVRMGGEGL